MDCIPEDTQGDDGRPGTDAGQDGQDRDWLGVEEAKDGEESKATNQERKTETESGGGEAHESSIAARARARRRGSGSDRAQALLLDK